MKNKYKKIWPWFVIPILFFVAGVIFTKTYRQAQIALSAEINERKKADTAVPTWLTTNKEIIQIKQTIYTVAKNEARKGCTTLDPITKRALFCGDSKPKLDNLQEQLVTKINDLMRNNK